MIPEGTKTSKGGKQAKDLPSYDSYGPQKCTAEPDKTESVVAALIPLSNWIKILLKRGKLHLVSEI